MDTLRLKKIYREEIVPKLMDEYKYKNVMQVPRLTKIVINMGLGKAVLEPKIIETATAELTKISGQKPIIRKARKAIANFKLREGMPIGCTVTLRSAKMYEFLDRFISASLPSVRDFKGVPRKAFDGRGNYTMGIKEHMIFPEIDFDKVDRNYGMNITFVTTAKKDEEARSLLGHFGMPFRKN